MQYQLSRFVAWPFLQSMGRPKVVGLDNVPGEGAAILASNHLSIIDSVYLPFVLPRPVVFPAKARREIGDRVMAAIRELSGQEYVHMYASDRKAELAAITRKPKD